MTQRTSPDTTVKAQPWMKWFTPGKEVPAVIYRAVEVYEDQMNGLRPAGIPATEFSL